MKYVTTCFANWDYEDTPELAVVDITPELMERVIELRNIAANNNIAEVKVPAEANWVSDEPDRFFNTMLHVTVDEMWLSCCDIRSDYETSTSGIKIRQLEEALKTGSELLVECSEAEERYVKLMEV